MLRNPNSVKEVSQPCSWLCCLLKQEKLKTIKVEKKEMRLQKYEEKSVKPEIKENLELT